MVPTFADLFFPKVQELFDENGNILDKKYIKRIHQAYDELIWLAKVLKWGRGHVKK